MKHPGLNMAMDDFGVHVLVMSTNKAVSLSCVSCRKENSEELRTLILRMLDKNPDTRITIPEIKVTSEQSECQMRPWISHLLFKRLTWSWQVFRCSCSGTTCFSPDLIGSEDSDLTVVQVHWTESVVEGQRGPGLTLDTCCSPLPTLFPWHSLIMCQWVIRYCFCAYGTRDNLAFRHHAYESI